MGLFSQLRVLLLCLLLLESSFASVQLSNDQADGSVGLAVERSRLYALSQLLSAIADSPQTQKLTKKVIETTQMLGGGTTQATITMKSENNQLCTSEVQKKQLRDAIAGPEGPEVGISDIWEDSNANSTSGFVLKATIRFPTTQISTIATRIGSGHVTRLMPQLTNLELSFEGNSVFPAIRKTATMIQSRLTQVTSEQIGWSTSHVILFVICLAIARMISVRGSAEERELLSLASLLLFFGISFLVAAHAESDLTPENVATLEELGGGSGMFGVAIMVGVWFTLPGVLKESASALARRARMTQTAQETARNAKDVTHAKLPISTTADERCSAFQNCRDCLSRECIMSGTSDRQCDSLTKSRLVAPGSRISLSECPDRQIETDIVKCDGVRVSRDDERDEQLLFNVNSDPISFEKFLVKYAKKAGCSGVEPIKQLAPVHGLGLLRTVLELRADSSGADPVPADRVAPRGTWRSFYWEELTAHTPFVPEELPDSVPKNLNLPAWVYDSAISFTDTKCTHGVFMTVSGVRHLLDMYEQIKQESDKKAKKESKQQPHSRRFAKVTVTETLGLLLALSETHDQNEVEFWATTDRIIFPIQAIPPTAVDQAEFPNFSGHVMLLEFSRKAGGDDAWTLYDNECSTYRISIAREASRKLKVIVDHLTQETIDTVTGSPVMVREQSEASVAALDIFEPTIDMSGRGLNTDVWTKIYYECLREQEGLPGDWGQKSMTAKLRATDMIKVLFVALAEMFGHTGGVLNDVLEMHILAKLLPFKDLRNSYAAAGSGKTVGTNDQVLEKRVKQLTSQIRDLAAANAITLPN